MNRIYYLLPYWVLNFTIGFGWFSLAPIVPDLTSQFSVSTAAILLLISVYGYTMVAFALLSGYISARYSVNLSLLASGIISAVGLFLRAFAPDYEFLLAAQVVAAVAYPLALGPVGTIAQSISPKRANMIVGVSVGVLFLGMSSGSFLTPFLFHVLGSVKNLFLLEAALAVVAFLLLPTVLGKYPKEYVGRSLRGSFKIGMLKNWYVGLVISSFSVMFGGIAATELINHGFALDSALYYSGMLSGLSFLGSALGAMILPPLFESAKMMRSGMVLTAGIALVSIVLLSYTLSHTAVAEVLMVSYFLFGFFGNAFWSLAMTSTTRYVSDPARSGLSTSMYSVATNLGVAFIPTQFGAYFIGNGTVGVVIVSLLLGVAFVLSFTLKTVGNRQAETKAETTSA